MVERSVSELQAIRARVAMIGKLSDSVITLGPLNLGLDGVLAWVPVVGEIYSVAAGGYIVLQGARANVPLPVLAACTALMFGRTVVTAVPLAGPLAADVLTAHKWSARLVIGAIDRKLGRMGAPAPARSGWLRRRAPVTALA